MTKEHENTMRQRPRSCQVVRGTEFEPYRCGRMPAVRVEDGRYVCRRCRKDLNKGNKRP